MATLLYIYHFAGSHLRTAVAVRHRQICKSAQDIQTRDDAAVLLDHGDIGLYLRNKFCIYLSLKCIYTFLCPQDLLLVFLKFLCNITFGIDQSLLSDPFFRHTVLVGIADFEVVAEDIIETYLERRDACAFDFALLHFEEVVLSVTGDLSQFVQLLIDSGSDDIALSELGCRLGMHCLSEIFQKLGTVTHSSDHIVEGLHSPSCAKLHYRLSLAQTTAKLHHLTRHDLACSGTGNDSFQVTDVAYHCLDTCQIILIIHEMLNHGISVFQLLQIHHRH